MQVQPLSMCRAIVIAGVLGLTTISAPTADPLEPEIIKPDSFPRFPAAMLRKGQSGFVLLQLRLADDGSTYAHRIVLSDPKGAFDKTVVDIARKKLRFEVPIEWVEKHPDRNYEMESNQPPATA
jgi:TonB family protein